MGTTTGQQIFDLAMGLSDNIGSTGLSDISDNTEYKNRTLPILNVLRLELYPLSDTRTEPVSGARSVSVQLTSLSDIIDLDDFLAQTVTPYGLAAHLLIDENPAMAGFFQQRYEELKQKFSTAPAEFEPINNVYQDYGFDQYSIW